MSPLETLEKVDTSELSRNLRDHSESLHYEIITALRTQLIIVELIRADTRQDEAESL